MKQIIHRLIQAIKEALAYQPQGGNRAMRRAEARVRGAKRTDGKFRGNLSLKKAREQYKLEREAHHVE